MYRIWFDCDRGYFISLLDYHGYAQLAGRYATVYFARAARDRGPSHAAMRLGCGFAWFHWYAGHGR